MSLVNAKLRDVSKTRGKPTLPDDVWDRFISVVGPLLDTRGTATKIAKATGLTDPAISQWKTSKNRPTFHNAVTALRAVGCDEGKIATVLGADPRFFSKPLGSRNLAQALGVSEAQLADLWDNDLIGDEMKSYEDKFQRAARALMHSEGCTLQEALAAITEAHAALSKSKDSGTWGVLKWADMATGFVSKGTQSGERPSVRLKKSGSS